MILEEVKARNQQEMNKIYRTNSKNRDSLLPNLSIVIVSYNVKELLLKCLESVETATKSIDSEVFVVDNDSRDGTVEAVEKEFSKVILIANVENLGFAKANNIALKLAKGKYILVLNPDTKLLPDTLSTMIKFMSDHDDVGIATCKIELPNGKLDRDCRRHFPTPWRAFTHFSGLSKIFSGSKLVDQYYYGYLPDDREIEVDACVGAFMMVQKKAIEEVGYFDEDFFFYGEDLDWCWRFREKGYKIMYTPITKIIHHKGASSGMKKDSQEVSKATKDSQKRALYESVHAMEIFYKKHYLKSYPFFINWLVIISLKVLEKVRTLSV